MTDIVMYERRCLYCDAPLSGRIDKKYCDDYCRNNHYYNIKKKNSDIVVSINKILLNNRNILKSLYKNKSKINRQYLLDKQFDFDLFTGVYRTKTKSEYVIIYDYAYKFVDDDVIVVIKYCDNNNY